jgi:ankyrin repeat protein
LDETYERILLAIDEEYRDIAVEALRWLCFSTEVLTIEVLAEAAVFSATVEVLSEESPLKASFDRDDLIQDPLDIMSVLSGLVVYRPPNNRSNDSDFDDFDSDEDLHSQPEIDKKKSKILLSHFSVKEYLISSRLGSRVDRFAIDERRTHGILATKCLYFILYCQEFLEYSEKCDDFRPTFRCPFFYYASEFWVHHAQTAEYESKLSHLIISLFEPEQPLKGLLTKMLENEQKYRAGTPLSQLAYLGLYWPCKEMIENGADVNMQGGLYGSALQAASIMGHENIVQLLLHHGANVNLQGGFYGSALQAATWVGNESIIKLLLDHRANVNMQGGILRCPLRAALVAGMENRVQLLLDHGADVNIQGERNRSPLHDAIENGGESALQLLLDHRAHISNRIGYYDEVLDHYYDKMLRNDPGSEIYAKIPVILLEHGAVMSKFHGGIEAEEALARKDFKRFVAIQMDPLKENSMPKKQRKKQKKK